MEVTRKYGEATTINMPMIKAGVNDFAASGDWTPVVADVQVSKDEAASADIAAIPVAISGMNYWAFPFTASEMTAKRISVAVVDAATKAVEDNGISIVTIDNASSQFGVLLTAAQVNTEVVDALSVDTYAEPGQGTPSATASIVTKIGHLYKQWRNKSDNDGSTVQLYNDGGGTVDQKRAVSEAGGTVTKDEVAAGP